MPHNLLLGVCDLPTYYISQIGFRWLGKKTKNYFCFSLNTTGVADHNFHFLIAAGRKCVCGGVGHFSKSLRPAHLKLWGGWVLPLQKVAGVFTWDWGKKKRFYLSCFSHSWLACGFQTSLFSSGLMGREQLLLPLAPGNSSFGRDKEPLSLPTADKNNFKNLFPFPHLWKISNFYLLPSKWGLWGKEASPFCDGVRSLAKGHTLPPCRSGEKGLQSGSCTWVDTRIIQDNLFWTSLQTPVPQIMLGVTYTRWYRKNTTEK